VRKVFEHGPGKVPRMYYQEPMHSKLLMRIENASDIHRAYILHVMLDSLKGDNATRVYDLDQVASLLR